MAFDVGPTRSSTAKTPKGKITAKTESQELSKENRERLALYVTNNGVKDVWLAYGGEKAVAEEGPRLVASTGTTVIENYSGPIHVITKEGESLVTFAEV